MLNKPIGTSISLLVIYPLITPSKPFLGAFNVKLGEIDRKGLLCISVWEHHCLQWLLKAELRDHPLTCQVLVPR